MTSEKYLAGAILIDSKALELSRGLVSPGDFADVRCRAVFDAAASILSEGGIVDPVTIRERAARMGTDVSNEYIVQLMEITPTAANAADYARRVAEDARRRRVKDLASRVLEDPASTAGELLATLQRETRELSTGTSAGLLSPNESLRRFTDFVAAAGEGAANFVPSRFPLLDNILGGGFIKGGLYIIGARPAVGKSSFAVNLADTIKGPVLFVSLEMGDELITAKRCSRLTGIPTGRILGGKLSDDEWGKIETATTYLFRSGVHLNSRFDLTVDQIQGLAQTVPGLQAIIIDYLGLIRPATKGGSTYENVSQVSRDLKRMALSLNVPVVCLSQLSRTVEGREDKRPRLSDLRDSGAIEQDADAVLFLYRDDYYKGTQATESAVQLNVAKNRHGSCGTTNFTFFRAISAFKEVS